MPDLIEPVFAAAFIIEKVVRYSKVNSLSEVIFAPPLKYNSSSCFSKLFYFARLVNFGVDDEYV